MSLLRRARELGALGATISGAGPTVLVWTHYEATGAVIGRLKPATAGPGAGAARPLRAPGGRRQGAMNTGAPGGTARIIQRSCAVFARMQPSDAACPMLSTCGVAWTASQSPPGQPASSFV